MNGNVPCSADLLFNFAYALPDILTPQNIYFIKNGDTVTMYVTDRAGNPYLVSGQGSDIILTSPNGTIDINQYAIDVDPSVLSSIITLHNNFPDLQGGTWHFNEEQHTRLLDLIYQNNITTFSTSPSFGERGVSQAVNVVFNIQSKDDVITSASINNGVGNILSYVDQGSTNRAAGNYKVTTTFVLSLGYNRNGVPTVETKNATYNAYTPQFAGVSSETDFTNYSALSTNLQKYVQSNSAINKVMTASNQYIWFISTNSAATIKDTNDFVQTVGNWGTAGVEFWTKSLNLTLADGTTTSTVYLYRTRQLKTFSNITYKIS